ncbi:MAG: protein-L-isoaspartate O-methyltransferase [Betaproteobacteria bacterium]|nr:protein-L-isoaspartate O-methyltransferase [Betaproteobacteria bacterium]
MDFEQARFNMVEQQIRPWRVADQDILDLAYLVPREEFVAPALRDLAFADLEIPIGEGERMWQPRIEARALQALAVRKPERVLEIGTGSGYLTALLAHRAAQVVSVELRAGLAEFGRANLARHGVDNITLEVGDGAQGWPGHAPYDVIVLTGSVPVLSERLLAQLAPGGRLFAVIGDAPVMVATLVTCIGPGNFRRAALFETILAPLAHCDQPARFRF